MIQNAAESLDASIAIAYHHIHETLPCGNSLIGLGTLPDESVDWIIADPPYNLKKAEGGTSESQEAYIHWSLQWIAEATRTLEPIAPFI